MKYTGKTILLLILISLQGFSFAGGPQTVITLVDKSSGKPVPFAHLSFRGVNNSFEKNIISGDRGKATVSLPGMAVMHVSYVGYEPVVDTIKPGQHRTLHLEPKVFNMEEVVITGQYTPERSDRSIYKIKVLNQEEIKMSASNNLQEILSSELNFRISQDNILGSSLSLQGASGENVKILVDGVPVIGRMNGNLDLSQINLNNVERIEIVEGPMSVNYGTNALAGAINIITKDLTTPGVSGNINTYYESVGRYNADGSLSFAAGEGDVILSGGRNFFDGYTPVDTGRRQQWKPKEQYFADAKYKRRINTLNLRVHSSLFKETVLDKGLPERATDTAGRYYYFTARDGYYNTLRTSHKAFLTGNTGKDSYIDVSVAYSYYKREKDLYIKNLYTGNKQLSANSEDADTTMFHAWQSRGTWSRYRNQDAAFKYQVGYDISLESATGSKIESESPSVNNYALFASAKYTPAEPLLIQAGARIAYNTQYDAPLTPSLNLKYDVNENLMLRSSYGKGFRAPSIKELYLNFKDLNHDIRGNGDLGAEKSDNVQVNMVFKYEKDYYGFRVEPDFFYNAIKNRIGLIERTELQTTGSQLDTALYYSYENFDIYKSLGYRVKFHYEHKKKVFFTAGYSNVGVLNQFSEEDAKQEYLFTPEYVLQMRYDFTEYGTQFNVRYKYTGQLERQRINFDNEFVTYREAAYQMMDFSINQDFFGDRISVVAGVKNIFDVKNIRTTGVTGGVHSSGGDSRSVAWGRTYFVDLTYNF